MSISNNLGLKLYGDDLLLSKPIGIEKADQFTYVIDVQTETCFVFK